MTNNKIYVYDDNSNFLEENISQSDPFDAKKTLAPPNSTKIQPPKINEDVEYLRFNQILQKWEVSKLVLLGTYWKISNGEKVDIFDPKFPLIAKDFVRTPPPCTYNTENSLSFNGVRWIVTECSQKTLKSMRLIKISELREVCNEKIRTKIDGTILRQNEWFEKSQNYQDIRYLYLEKMNIVLKGGYILIGCEIDVTQSQIIEADTALFRKEQFRKKYKAIKTEILALNCRDLSEFDVKNSDFWVDLQKYQISVDARKSREYITNLNLERQPV